MRPRATRKPALSWVSCNPPPPRHSATTAPALARKRRASPQPAILPRVALTRRSVAPGAAAVNDTIAPGGASARRALGVGLLVRLRRRRRPRVLSAGAALARRPGAAARQRHDRPRRLARPAHVGGARRRARRRRARSIRRPRDLDRQRPPPRRHVAHVLQ